MTTAIYDNCYTCWNRCPTDPGDECRSLGSLLTDANGVGFPSNTSVENVDIVATGREVKTGIGTDGNIVTSGCVRLECVLASGGVVATGCVAIEGGNTRGNVVTAGEIAIQGIGAVSSVIAAIGKVVR